MYKRMDDITVEQVTEAAQKNGEKYIDRFQKVAQAAFIKGVLWAQKYQEEGPTC